jgi:TolA-binding protein
MTKADPAGQHRGQHGPEDEPGGGWQHPQAWLGAAEAATGDHRQAARLHRDGLRMAEELGLWPQAADALSWLGRSALRSGDLAQARELLERAMRLATEQSYQPGQVFAEIGLGMIARREGRLDVAEAHLRSVLRTSQRHGSEPDVAREVSCPSWALSPSSAVTPQARAHGT